MAYSPKCVFSRDLEKDETIHDNTNEMEALRLTNKRLIRELEQLTKQIQRSQEVRQAQDGHNTTLQEEQPHLGPPREVEIEAESIRARGHEPYLPPERSATKQYSGGTSETMSQLLISKE